MRNQRRQLNALERIERPVRAGRSGFGPGAEMIAKSLVDPFNFSGCIPDGSKGTGCFSCKGLQTLATSTGGGVVGFFLFLDPSNTIILNTATTSATNLAVTGNYNYPASQSTIDNLYARYRPISAGIKATYIGNTQTDAGVLYYGQVSGGTAPNAFNASTPASMAVSSQYFKSSPLRNGATVTWRPESMDDMTDWWTIATPGGAVSSIPVNAWIYVAAAGLPASTTPIQIEWIINFEGQFGNQTFLAGGVDVAEAHSPAEPGWYEKVQNAISGVTPMLPAIAESFGDVAGRAVRGMAPALGNALGSAMGNGMFYPSTISRPFRLTY